MKLLVSEPESAALIAELGDPKHQTVSSDLLETELGRVAVRVGASGGDVAAILALFDLATPDRSTYRQAALLPHPTLRSLDALHIAAAIDLNADAIVTYDMRMIEACQALGITVLSPK
ncbi:MAG: type II toxin-antitoxin system VapC family toxin [Micrococcales bacterium]|nr:type II toxin-antitoxin system VapC family toxin [Micrococcales bacterium]